MFCQAIYEVIAGEEWEELYCYYREMSKVAGPENQVRIKKQKPLGQQPRTLGRNTMIQLDKTKS